MRIYSIKGFGTIALVVVVVVIGAAIGTGVYISRSQKKTANNEPTPRTISNFDECVAAGNPVMESFPEQCMADGQTFVNQKPQDSPQPSISYLVIQEWGVRFQHTDATIDAYYHFFPDRPDHAYLSLTSLKDIEYCGADKTGIAALSRFKDGDQDDMREQPMTESYPDAPKIGDYYYYVTGAQAACADDEAALEKASAARKAFIELLKTLEAS